MKKILLILLTLVLCIGLLAACGGDETTGEPSGSSTPTTTGSNTPATDSGLQKAREYLRTLYIDAVTGTKDIAACPQASPSAARPTPSPGRSTPKMSKW